MEKSFLPEKTLCNGCQACVSICPKQCINMKMDADGFLYPKIDTEKCINCGLCKKTCPILEGKVKENFSELAFAFINKDSDKQIQSSSGGAFCLVAKNVLSLGGVVFGAAFSEDYKSVSHIAVEEEKDLYLLMGSKYLQSDINLTYKLAKDYLDTNRIVLFSGTPCQVAGLYAFLNKEYENLYTQDIICHGVPSPLVWSKYLEYREEKNKSIAEKVTFRNKSNGWKNYRLQIIFKNGNDYAINSFEDIYMRGFLNNLYLRNSCYNCSFKSFDRVADITLADFWGVENLHEEFYDNNGTSLVLVNTQKGIKLFDSIKSHAKVKEVDKSEALQYNVSAYKSVEMNLNRDVFMQNLNTLSIEKNISQYCKISLKTKIKSKIKKVLKG